MPTEQFAFTNEINIYDDKVAIISFKEELIGMIIESHEISESQRAIFNNCWQFATMVQNSEAAKTKLLEPISEKEAKEAMKREEKAAKEDNLSLF